MGLTTTADGNFLGAKCALFIGIRLVVLRRDDKPGLLWAGALDFPGGGRDPGEMRPETTVLREIREEIGLELSASQFSYTRRYEKPEGFVWFFAAHLEEEAAKRIVFGNEGQYWTLMTPEDFLTAADAVSVLQDRLRTYLDVRA